MAEVIERYTVELDPRQLEQMADRIGNSLEGAARKGAAENAKLNLSFMVVYEAAMKFASAMKDSFMSVVEAEKLEAQLGVALRTTGHELENNTKALKAQAERWEQQFGIDDKIITQLQTKALYHGKNASEIDNVIKASRILSDITGQDLATAFDTLERAQVQGTTRSIELKAIFGDLSAEEMKNLDIAGELSKKYGDVLAADMRSTATSIAKLGEAFEGLGESLTGLLLQLDLPRWLNDLSNGIRLVTESIGFGLDGLKLTEERATRVRQIMADIGGGGTVSEGWGGGAPKPTDKSEEMQAAIEEKKKTTSSRSKKEEDYGVKFDITGIEIYKSNYEEIQKAAAENEKLLEEIDKDRIAFAKRANEILLENQKAFLEEKAESERIYNDKVKVMSESRADYQLQLARKQAAENEKLRAAQIKEQQKTAQMMSASLMIIGNELEGTFEKVLSGEGAKLRLDKFLSTILKSIGRMVLSKGIADMAVALANFAVYKDPTGIAPAAAEIAIGGTMSAAGFLVGGGASAGGGEGAEAGAESPASNFSGSSAGRASSGSGGGGGERVINITINGPMLNSPQMGVEIRKALAAASKQGL